MKGLSGVRGNFHAPFLGEGAAARPFSYPTALEIVPPEAHESEPVSDLILHFVTRQVLEGRRHKDFEYEHRIKWKTADFLPRGATQTFLQGLAKANPGDLMHEPFERMAFFAQVIITMSEVKEAKLGGCMGAIQTISSTFLWW